MKFELPIDQVLNSERILASGVYQRKEWNFKEDKWFIKYLIDSGWDKEQIYYKWLEIFLTRERNTYLMDDARSLFEHFYKKAGKIKKLIRYPAVKVFQQEIDFINDSKAPLQVKQLALLLLVYCKLNRSYQFIDGVFEVLLVSLKRMTKAKRQVRREDTSLSGVLESCGIICKIEIDKRSWYFPDQNEYDYKRITFVHKKGKTAFETSTILDVPKHFNLLHCRAICPVCGKEYDVSPKSKTDLCPDCQKEKRKQRIVAFSEARRHEKEKNT